MDKTSASGIYTAEDGSRYVGGSVRPDGSVRRARKVKPGYVPEEDVPKYVPIGRRRALGQEVGGVIPKTSVDSEEDKTNQSRNKVGRPLRHPRQDLDENNKRPIRSSVRPVLNEEPSEKQAPQSRGRTIRPVKTTRPILDDENKRPIHPIQPVAADNETDALVRGISGLSLNNATKVTAEVDKGKTKVLPTESKVSKENTSITEEKDASPHEKNVKSDQKSSKPSLKGASSSEKDVKPNQSEDVGQTENTAPKPSSQKYIPPWKRK